MYDGKSRFFYGYTESFKISHTLNVPMLFYQGTEGIAGEPEIVHVRKLFNPVPSM